MPLLAPWPALADARLAREEPLRDAQLFPRGHRHWKRCWQLERDYCVLRARIAETGVVWRRQRLEQEWEMVRDERRASCLLGW